MGTRIFSPAMWDGENLPVGDLHFCQGDGEIALRVGQARAGHPRSLRQP